MPEMTWDDFFATVVDRARLQAANIPPWRFDCMRGWAPNHRGLQVEIGMPDNLTVTNLPANWTTMVLQEGFSEVSFSQTPRAFLSEIEVRVSKIDNEAFCTCSKCGDRHRRQ